MRHLIKDLDFWLRKTDSYLVGVSEQNKYTNTIVVSLFPRACGDRFWCGRCNNRFNIYLLFFF